MIVCMCVPLVQIVISIPPLDLLLAEACDFRYSLRLVMLVTSSCLLVFRSSLFCSFPLRQKMPRNSKGSLSVINALCSLEEKRSLT